MSFTVRRLLSFGWSLPNESLEVMAVSRSESRFRVVKPRVRGVLSHGGMVKRNRALRNTKVLGITWVRRKASKRRKHNAKAKIEAIRGRGLYFMEGMTEIAE